MKRHSPFDDVKVGTSLWKVDAFRNDRAVLVEFRVTDIDGDGDVHFVERRVRDLPLWRLRPDWLKRDIRWVCPQTALKKRDLSLDAADALKRYSRWCDRWSKTARRHLAVTRGRVRRAVDACVVARKAIVKERRR